MDQEVTRLSEVDRWECHQSTHMYMRFHGARFYAAEAHAFATSGTPHWPWLCGGHRFKRKLRCGGAVRMDSERKATQQFVHRLSVCDAMEPSAALETNHGPHAPPYPLEEPNANPSTLYRSIVGGAGDCKAHGLGREAILGLVNHTRTHPAFDQHKPRDTTCRLLNGSATMTCRIVMPAPAGPGILTLVRSPLAGCNHTSLRRQYRITDDTVSACVARVEPTLVFLTWQRGD